MRVLNYKRLGPFCYLKLKKWDEKRETRFTTQEHSRRWWIIDYNSFKESKAYQYAIDVLDGKFPTTKYIKAICKKFLYEIDHQEELVVANALTSRRLGLHPCRAVPYQPGKYRRYPYPVWELEKAGYITRRQGCDENSHSPRH